MTLRPTACALTLLLVAPSLSAQPGRGGRSAVQQRFARSAPALGERLPDIEVLDPAGEAVPLRSLKGSYTVLVLGCLT